MLKDKVAIVTGGSTGIGKAISLMLASQGAKVVINYIVNESVANEVVKEIIDQGGFAIAKEWDVTSFEDTERCVKEIKKELGSIDILVNNAGITKDNLLLRMKEQEFDSVINVNLKGVFNCTKHCSKIMLKQRAGKIINITSVVGIMGNIGQCNYAASKAGVIGFTKSTAREFAARGVTVNAIAPGFINTTMTDVLGDDIKNEFMKKIPLSRIGTPEDISNVVKFLASQQSDYITGQVISVDGGMNI